MGTSRSSGIRWLFLFVFTAFFSFPAGSARAGEVWEIWSRLCYTADMSTEWLVADDKDWNALQPPDRTRIYLLVPPVINKAGDHWEITFNTAGKVKNQLEEHFDNSRAYRPMAPGYKGVATERISFQLDGQNHPYPWLMIRSKNFWDGRRDLPNLDSKNTGTPYQFNLDPENAMGISFLEPTVTQKDGEWILTTAVSPDENEKTRVSQKAMEWERNHPGPKAPPAPKLIYPPPMQKKHDQWLKALRKWQKDQPGGNSPNPDDFYQFTPEQKQQYEEWQRTLSRWQSSGGAGAFPQPIDFIKY